MLWILLVVAQTDALKPPPYYTSVERWRCTFPAFEGKDDVTDFFGVFRSHVESLYGSDYTIIQNDAAALIFASANYGETDISGKTLHYASIDMLDKKSRRFKRTVLTMESKSDERTGECQPY